MTELPVSIIYIRKDGELIPVDSKNNTKKKLFLSSVKEGEQIEVTYERVSKDGSYAQLSLIHPCIRDLAAQLGESFDDMKKMVKERSGFKIIAETGNYKSFADCDKEELSTVIRTVIELGEFCGANYRTM